MWACILLAVYCWYVPHALRAKICVQLALILCSRVASEETRVPAVQVCEVPCVCIVPEKFNFLQEFLRKQ